MSNPYYEVLSKNYVYKVLLIACIAYSSGDFLELASDNTKPIES